VHGAVARGVRLLPTRRCKSLPAARAWRLHSGARRAADPRGATDPRGAANARAARGADHHDLAGLLRLSRISGGPHAHHAHLRTEPPRQSPRRRRRLPHHLGKGRRPSPVRPYTMALARRPRPNSPPSPPSPHILSPAHTLITRPHRHPPPSPPPLAPFTSIRPPTAATPDSNPTPPLRPPPPHPPQPPPRTLTPPTTHQVPDTEQRGRTLSSLSPAAANAPRGAPPRGRGHVTCGAAR